MSEHKKTGWNFDNSYTNLPKSFFTFIHPTHVRSSNLIILNESLAESLGLDPEFLKSENEVSTFSGNRIPEGANPLAQAYAGHQFGHFTMLGDGRAILIGEHIIPNGERVDIQLKGAGRTPYSRGGDGRAALGPMLREYIISEAMHALGIPTTRSLAVVATGEVVQREKALPGAILTRVAASHIRVGTFQYVAKWGTIEELKTLADYTINRHFPHIKAGSNDAYIQLLQEVIKYQADLLAKWQLVGFVHGVMNTDNMTISGETIDYGPCAFMDTYDPRTVFSSIDTGGRYAFGNQPAIAVWNLARLAEALLPLLHENEGEAVKCAESALTTFAHLYHSNFYNGMRAKLGIFNEESEDEALIEELLSLMENHRADYTNTFRSLTFGKLKETSLFGITDFSRWVEKWESRRNRQEESSAESHQLMKKNNPSVIPRNHRVEAALEAAIEKRDYRVMERLLQVLSNPFAYSPEQEDYCTLPSKSTLPYQTYCGT